MSFINPTYISVYRSINTIPRYAKSLKNGTSGPEQLSLMSRVGSCFQKICHVAKDLFHAKVTDRNLEKLSFLSLASLPLVAHNMVGSGKTLKKGTTNEKIDAVLSIISGIGSLGGIAESFASGLYAFRVVGEGAIRWITPFMLIMIPFDIAAIVLNRRKCDEVAEFNKIFRAEAGLDKSINHYDLEDFKQGLKLIRQRAEAEVTFVSKHFGGDKDQLLSRLQKIEQNVTDNFYSLDANEVRESRKEMYEIMSVLSEQNEIKRKTYSFNAAMGAVGLVALGVFFISPPLAWIGYALASVVSLSFYVYTVRKFSVFKEDLGINKS